MNKILVILFLYFFLFCLPVFIFGANNSDFVINEIAWMGTTASANDEWIELKNNTGQDINLDGWTLGAADGAPEIKLTGTIPANGFYLLERTDDTTVPNITADLIYKGALGNSGEDLWLYDDNNNLIDEVDCTEKWFAGDNATKQTMETLRQAQGENRGWQTSENVGGTPKAENSQGEIALPSSADSSRNDETTNASLREAPQGDEAIIINYPTGVILNEILPSPEGADDQNEWIELYNTNNFEIDLSGWKIKDTTGTTTTFIIPKYLPAGRQAKISAYGYLIFKRPDTKITLNNTTDGLTLYWPNEKIIDFMTYEKAPINQSYNKIGANWQWSISLTPNAKNIIVQAEDLSKIEKSGNSKEIDQNLAAINQSINQEKKNKFLASESENTNPWFLFLVALSITIFSAIIVLFIKFKFYPIK